MRKEQKEPKKDKEKKIKEARGQKAEAAETKPLHPLAEVVVAGEKIVINQREYRLLINQRDALDREVLKQKYDPYLDQYDYLVGDVSSDHLRLRGFYNDYVKTSIDRKKSTIVDYLTEYCNPGAPYFILESLQPSRKPRPTQRRRPARKRPKNKAAFTERKVKDGRPKKGSYAESRKKNRRHQAFVIRKKKS
ncbi:MAG: YutD family protein [Lactobacillus delbrueckii]|nr:YutD family protein [Lactobacillus delbrueckii]MDY5602817.1 YutD family protein [Lactobacillus delbrueckii]